MQDFAFRKAHSLFQHLQVDSGYWWEGRITEDKEFGAIMKTSKFREKDVFKRLKQLHPYSVPVILSVEVESVDEDYKQWLQESIEAR